MGFDASEYHIQDGDSKRINRFLCWVSHNQILLKKRKEIVKATPKITKLELITFEYQIRNLSRDSNGFTHLILTGSVEISRQTILKIHTDLGVTGAMKIAHLSPTVHR